MEAELDHEVRALQKKIQQSARRSIVENYGEGAVQVHLDLYNPEGDEEENESEEQEHAGGSLDSNSADAGSAGGRNAKNRIAIRLWYDTPHSAWTFLSQVSSGQWDGAVIDWNVAATGGRSIAARAAGGATTLEPELHFVEQSERGHERYTIGLNTDTGSLFINLQDNRDFYKSEPCVGTIVNGFDVLHRVIRAAQKHTAAAGAGNGSNNSNPVRIKRARVSHVTTRA
jgi:cyclophilin family peptidyl-prolyl cis-trans isomerase